ncbi:hypothetical protein GGF46_001003 [Coemansia sp. RSA 552]|nr:hypothetical protein GGF46_001003 [Coemansia sp. RSA 552]
MALNVVLLRCETRDPEPLPGENFLYHCNGVKFELKSGSGYPGDPVQFAVSSGTAFVSNQRVVYLPVHTTYQTSNQTPTDRSLNSFTIPHANLKNQEFTQPLFGSNCYKAFATPVPGGGIAGSATLTLTFKEGGGYDFYETARKVVERTQETGEVPPYDETLPVYDNAGGASAAPAAPLAGYPDDAPPGYEQHDFKR